MKKRIIVALALLLVCVVSTAYAMDTFYVKTANGKGLNLRSAPERGDNVVASIPYGAQIEAIDVCMDGVWINVSYNGNAGWVMYRYLTSSRPNPKPTAKPNPTPTPTGSSNLDYSSFKNTSYSAIVRPSVAGGWVHMRWAPSKSMPIRKDYFEGDRVEIIAQNAQWAQVRDGETGEVGFIMLQFLQYTGDGTSF